MRVRQGWAIGAAALGIVLMTGCSPTGSEQPTPSPSSEPPAAAIDWGDRPQSVVVLDGGFGVTGCEGDAPLLCVEEDGEHVGTIEYLSFEAPAGADALTSLVEDDYDSFRADREDCSPGYSVVVVDPADAEVAGGTGLRSDYSVVDAEGNTVERYVKYWVVSEGRVHLMTAEAQEEGTCYPAEGVTFGAEGLEGFEPAFESLAMRSRFPAGG